MGNYCCDIVVNTWDDLQEIENILMENSVFHVMMVMMHLPLFGYKFTAIDLKQQ